MKNKITLGSTYYNNPNDLKKFIDIHGSYVDEIIIVDDGSPRPITDYLLPTKKLRLFRVLKDYGFNSHGCRNLIVNQSTNEFVILMDLDRKFVFPEIAFQRILTTKLKKNVRYRFMAHSGSIYADSHYSVNDYLISKTHFFSAGGYDEEIIGQRWGDREYFEQLLHFGYEKVLYDVDMLLTRKPSTQIGVNSPNDIRIKDSDLIKQRIKNPEPNKPIITFEWEEIK